MCNLSYEHSSGMQIIHFQQRKKKRRKEGMLETLSIFAINMGKYHTRNSKKFL